MKEQAFSWPLPPCIEAINFDGVTYCIESEADYAAAKLPQPLREFFATRQPPAADPMRDQFEAEQQAKLAAEFEAFKARAGAPSYKASALKIAAEKLGLLDAIDAAIMVLVDKASDKALYVWWRETAEISRGDAQWQQIEAAVAWGKGASAADLFNLASQI